MRLIALLLLLFAVMLPAVADVHVRGYYRKDGTYVRPHTRRSPGSRSYGFSSSPRLSDVERYQLQRQAEESNRRWWADAYAARQQREQEVARTLSILGAGLLLVGLVVALVRLLHPSPRRPASVMHEAQPVVPLQASSPLAKRRRRRVVPTPPSAGPRSYHFCRCGTVNDTSAAQCWKCGTQAGPQARRETE